MAVSRRSHGTLERYVFDWAPPTTFLPRRRWRTVEPAAPRTPELGVPRLGVAPRLGVPLSKDTPRDGVREVRASWWPTSPAHAVRAAGLESRFQQLVIMTSKYSSSSMDTETPR